ncbi:MAG TPA: penicillin-binding protein activator [Croceibacterium sp.]|nr:penicillin-binding protein activator [Croceibacterium sp.]
MFGNWKRLVGAAALSVALAACQVVPKGEGPVVAPRPVPTAAPSTLPQDEGRHRVALLVPLSGANGAVGQSIANATTMALLDTNASNLRITTYDTASGAESAAARAIADGNKLILGPLLGDDVRAVSVKARPAHVPMITFSNDRSIATRDVFVLGVVPEESINRTVSYAMAHGAKRFAAIVPNGDYGRHAQAALAARVAAGGGTLVATETYDRGNTSVISAAERLRTRGGFDTVLIADSARLSAIAAGSLKTAGAALPHLLGTELWSGEEDVAKSSALRGAWFSTVSDSRYGRFATSYKSRFGARPYRVATLGYDAVLLTLRIARDWTGGREFPTSHLFDDQGFLGIDGAFRFRPDGIAERAMEVRQVGAGTITVVSPAPTQF